MCLITCSDVYTVILDEEIFEKHDPRCMMHDVSPRTRLPFSEIWCEWKGMLSSGQRLGMSKFTVSGTSLGAAQVGEITDGRQIDCAISVVLEAGQAEGFWKRRWNGTFSTRWCVPGNQSVCPT